MVENVVTVKERSMYKLIKESEIKTVVEAQLYADIPPEGHLKCSGCGYIVIWNRSIDYDKQSHCPHCNYQMMSRDWAGWYNRWKSIALHYVMYKDPLFKEHMAALDEGIPENVLIGLKPDAVARLRRFANSSEEFKNNVINNEPIKCVVCKKPIMETGTALNGDSMKPCHIECYHHWNNERKIRRCGDCGSPVWECECN